MKILVGSPNPVVIRRWLDMLSSSFIDQAGTVEELKRRFASKTFDLILLHRSLVDLTSFSALREALPSARFFLLSDQPSDEEGLAFLKAGIAGYGNTYISKARLMEAVHVITGGGVWLGQKVIQRLILDMAARAPQRATPESGKALGLTRMERKIADMVAKGLTNLEIAAELNITERTVKAHLTSAYAKTGTGNRLALALLINRQKV